MGASVFAELGRRRVFRALVGYGIAAFAVLQVIEPIMHGLHWPDAVLSYVVVALAARTNAARSALNRSAERRWRAPSSAPPVTDLSLSHPLVWGPPLPLIH